MFGDTVVMVYVGMKFFLLFTLAGALIRVEPLREQTFVFSLLYTAGVAFLSWVFLIAPATRNFWPSWRAWQVWLAVTCVLSFVWFRALAWLEEKTLFWLVLFLGFPLVLY